MRPIPPRNTDWTTALSVCALLAVLVAGLVLYWPALGGAFLADDFGYVQLYGRTHLTAFPGLFAADWSQGIWGSPLPELRPLVGLTYWIDYRLWGAEATGYHASNVLFHTLAAVGAYLFILESGRCLTTAPVEEPESGSATQTVVSDSVTIERRLHATAAIGTLLFVLHPTHLEAVAWIAGRTDLLGAAACCWSLFSLARGWRLSSVALGTLGVALFAAGLFMKEHVITVPLVFGALVASSGRLRRRLRGGATLMLALLVVAGAWLVVRRAAFGDSAGVTSLSDALQSLWTRVPFYASHALPFELPVMAVVGVAVLIYAAWARPDLRRMLLFWTVCWTSLQVAPLLAVTYESGRHVLLASAGPVVALSAVAAAWDRHRVAAASALVSCLACGLMFGAQTTRGLAAWEESSRHSRQLLDLLSDPNYSSETVLVVNNAPPGRVWFWQWALPFAAQPPFAEVQAAVVAPREWYCCEAAKEARDRLLVDITADRALDVYWINFMPDSNQFEATPRRR